MSKPTIKRPTRPSSPKRRPVPKPVLALPGDPLVLGNGAVIPDGDRDDGIARDKALAQRPVDKTAPRDFRPLKKRTSKEMPATPDVMKGVAVVFVFTMLGLTDREICESLGISDHMLQTVREHSAYADVFDNMHNEFINAESELLSSRIAAYSHNALDRVAEFAGKSKNDMVGFKAADSLLDRAMENKGNNGQKSVGLRVIVVDGEANIDVKVNL